MIKDKRTLPKDVKMKKPLPKKKVDVTIVVALIGLIGTLATVLFNSPVILELLQNNPTPTAQTIQLPLSVNSSNPTPLPSVPSLTEGNGDCLTQYFAGIDTSRQISIEVGVTDQGYSILSEDLSKKDFIGPIGIRLTQNAKMIAALSFVFFNDSHLFKITSIVDSNCQTVKKYSNVDRGGDHNAIQDSDTLKVELTQGSYSLRFVSWRPSEFHFNFQQLQ